MKASECQVGGSHYHKKEGGIGHWDYCTKVNVPYLEGCATKYLTRWRDKNGMQDLYKSLHYLERRIEAIHEFEGITYGARKDFNLFRSFVIDNQIPNEEAIIIDLIMHWQRFDDLFEAQKQLQDFIEREESSEPTSAYVNQG